MPDVHRSLSAISLTPRRTKRADAVADVLLDPVEKLLRGGRSFTDLTVADIVAASGVKRSTFYYHFDDKVELLVAISERAVREIVASSLRMWAVDPAEREGAFEGRVRDTVVTWREHVALMRALSEAAAYDPRAAEQWRAGWEVARDAVVDHVVAGQRDGTVRPELDAEYTATWLVWMAERGMTQFVPDADIDRAVHSLTQILTFTFYGDAR